MNGIAEYIVDLIFTPGSSLKLVRIIILSISECLLNLMNTQLLLLFQVPVINISVLLLLGVLAFLTYTKIDTIHIIVMSSLSVGLLLSVNW